MPASVLLFRVLLMVCVVTGLIGSFLDLAFPQLVPEPMSQAFDALPPPPALALFGASLLVFVTFGGVVTAVVGLYLLQPWARPLALWMTGLSLLFHPLLGVQMQSGWAQLFLEISTLLWGAVLTMSYLSSVSARFASR
jgi:hypothetical protein